VLRQERAREHRTALHSRPSSAARGARPAQDPGGHHHHAGPSQPRRHCALSSTAKPATRPPTCGCSTAPHHHAQSRVQKQKAHSTQPKRLSELSPRATSTGLAPTTRRKQDSEQSSARQKEAAHHAGLRTAGGAAVRRDERLLSSFCRTTAQRKKGPEVAVALKANSAVRHLRRVRHVKAGPVETRRRGTSATYAAYQHTSWANSRAGGNNRGPASSNISSDREKYAHDMPRADMP